MSLGSDTQAAPLRRFKTLIEIPYQKQKAWMPHLEQIIYPYPHSIETPSWRQVDPRPSGREHLSFITSGLPTMSHRETCRHLGMP